MLVIISIARKLHREMLGYWLSVTEMSGKLSRRNVIGKTLFALHLDNASIHIRATYEQLR